MLAHAADEQVGEVLADPPAMLEDLGGQAVFGPDLAYVSELDYSVDPARAADLRPESTVA